MDSRNGPSQGRPALSPRLAVLAEGPTNGSGRARHRREEDVSATGGTVPSGGSPAESRVGRVDRVDWRELKQRQCGRCGQGDQTGTAATGDGVGTDTLCSVSLTVQVRTAVD